MWLNQRTIDGIRVMATLAKHAPNSMRASDLAETTKITLMNVQKTTNMLSRAGFILTNRGRNGGVVLSRSADDIMISEIVRIFEPIDCPVHFIMGSKMEAAINKLVFDAHRGFFDQLGKKKLSDVLG